MRIHIIKIDQDERVIDFLACHQDNNRLRSPPPNLPHHRLHAPPHRLLHPRISALPRTHLVPSARSGIICDVPRQLLPHFFGHLDAVQPIDRRQDDRLLQRPLSTLHLHRTQKIRDLREQRRFCTSHQQAYKIHHCHARDVLEQFVDQEGRAPQELPRPAEGIRRERGRHAQHCRSHRQTETYILTSLELAGVLRRKDDQLRSDRKGNAGPPQILRATHRHFRTPQVPRLL